MHLVNPMARGIIVQLVQLVKLVFSLLPIVAVGEVTHSVLAVRLDVVLALLTHLVILVGQA